jgi:hypothetical protein
MTATLIALSPELVLTDEPQALPLLPRQAYDDLAGWNASLLKIAISRTPAHAWAAYRDPNRPEQVATPNQVIGSALHAMLLEPEDWQEQFVTIPADAPKRPTETQLTTGADSKPGTKVHTAWMDAQARELWWADFDTRTADATVMPAADYDLVLRLGAAVESHPGLAPLFGPQFRHLNEIDKEAM